MTANDSLSNVAEELAAVQAELKAVQEKFEVVRTKLANVEQHIAAVNNNSCSHSVVGSSSVQSSSYAVCDNHQSDSQQSFTDNQYSYNSQSFPYNRQNRPQPIVAAKDHVAAGLLAIFLGTLGIHKFYLGYNTSGFIMLGVSILGGILTLSIASWVVWLIAIIEGIIYLTRSQSEFEQIYVFNKREWF